MLFRRPGIGYGRTPGPETPFQKAAQVWDERIGPARVQARNWRLIAFGNLLVAAALAAGLIWQAARGTVTPWVVECSQSGSRVTCALSQTNPGSQNWLRFVKPPSRPSQRDAEGRWRSCRAVAILGCRQLKIRLE
jgi:type IV secretory pathway TrbF-like protein